MSVVLRMQIKDKGSITWPALPDPEKGVQGLREVIQSKASDTRAALGSLETARVFVHVTFRPDIMVDPL